MGMIFVLIILAGFIMGEIPILLILYFFTRNISSEKRRKVFIKFFIINIPVFIIIALPLVKYLFNKF